MYLLDWSILIYRASLTVLGIHSKLFVQIFGYILLAFALKITREFKYIFDIYSSR